MLALLLTTTNEANASARESCDWCDDDGGIFNAPSVEFNPTYWGYGSSGQKIYNKLDLQDGRTMYIDGGISLFDNQGNVIAKTVDERSGIGYYNGSRDGGLIPGSLRNIKVGGKKYQMTYAWSVNVNGGGRASGWVLVDRLSPSSDIVEILEETRAAKLAAWEDARDEGDYQAFTVQEAYLPRYMEEYYLDPGRDASYTAGKAKYYYTRDGNNTGLINIPETGSQRYGVGHDVLPIGSKFYRDMTVEKVKVSIYAPSSTKAVGHTLQLVWGYSVTSAGNKVWSWVNGRTLD